jgi:hypothetical protein
MNSALGEEKVVHRKMKQSATLKIVFDVLE